MKLTQMERGDLSTAPLLRSAVCHQMGSADLVRLQLQEDSYTGRFFELDMTLDEAETLFRNGLAFIARLRGQA